MLFKDGKSEDYALNVSYNGLSHLYSFVKSEENKRAEVFGEKSVLLIDFGQTDTNGVILNHFFWYSTSLFPFIGLFSKAYHLNYDDLRSTFCNVIKWRHKIAAHFAWADKKPRREDTDMLLQASINQYVSWDAHRFSVGREVIKKNYEEGGTQDSTPADWGWELTETHERLEQILKPYVGSTIPSF